MIVGYFNKNKDINALFDFDVKYLQENIFSFYSIYFAVKYLVKSKIFSIN